MKKLILISFILYSCNSGDLSSGLNNGNTKVDTLHKTWCCKIDTIHKDSTIYTYYTVPKPVDSFYTVPKPVDSPYTVPKPVDSFYTVPKPQIKYYDSLVPKIKDTVILFQIPLYIDPIFWKYRNDTSKVRIYLKINK